MLMVLLVRLGQSGLKISKIVLGCMSYGNPSGTEVGVLEEEEASKQIKAAYDGGINAFDTANVYSSGASEEVLGRAIKQHQLPRDEIVVMTKHIFDSVKHSLRRLQLDYIDLLQCHRFDNETPIEETMQALHDVVKAGYVRYIGMSSCYAWQCKLRRHQQLTPFISMQNHHNLLYREEEREMFPTLKQLGVGAIPWSPLARGALTRPLDAHRKTKRGESDVYVCSFEQTAVSVANETIVQRVEEIAKKREISMAQVSIAWSLSKEGISAPIVGTTSIANLADAIAAVHVKLTEDEIKYLEEPYQPMGIIGH
ncbi:Aldo/keto reductase [Mycena olivaceomarginata]|nr:Aldo/keto reductase [Mycena olivaceomarginata]